MFRAVQQEMDRLYRIRDWKSYYGLAWYVGMLSTKEAERLYFQKQLVITLEGNCYRR